MEICIVWYISAFIVIKLVFVFVFSYNGVLLINMAYRFTAQLDNKLMTNDWSQNKGTPNQMRWSCFKIPDDSSIDFVQV